MINISKNNNALLLAAALTVPMLSACQFPEKEPPPENPKISLVQTPFSDVPPGILPTDPPLPELGHRDITPNPGKEAIVWDLISTQAFLSAVMKGSVAMPHTEIATELQNQSLLFEEYLSQEDLDSENYERIFAVVTSLQVSSNFRADFKYIADALVEIHGAIVAFSSER